MPPLRRTHGELTRVPTTVVPLGERCRAVVEQPALDGVWLVQLPGTTADPSIFPPDRSLPTVSFDFRELQLDPTAGADDRSPFHVFHRKLDLGLGEALAAHEVRHLVIVGHSFGGMLGLDWLLDRPLEVLRAHLPTLEHVTLVLACAAHRSPLDEYRIRSDAPLVGPFATWLSRHVMQLGTTSKARLERVMGLLGREPPKALWRIAPGTRDELEFCSPLPKASSVDHFWQVVQCARTYDTRTRLAESGRLWFDLLILSAEHDAQWAPSLFEELWALVPASGLRYARWCAFRGDDHLGFARNPVKYYKEIKDFVAETRAQRGLEGA